MPTYDRVIGVAAGLSGAAGVAVSAAGAHAYAGTNFETAGEMLIVHAAALLALSVPSRASTRVRQIAALVMVVGLLLFCGTLIMGVVQGASPFPMAAPLGGLLLIASWLIAAVAAMAGRGQG